MNRFYSGAIVYNTSNKTILLQHRTWDAPINPNKWGLFGGSNEGEETPSQTLIRELKEEIGILFEEKDFELILDYDIEPSRHRYLFLIKKDFSKISIQLGEGQGFDWVPTGKISTYDLTVNTKRDILYYLNKYEPK